MWPNLQFPADLVTFTEDILNRKLHFLWSGSFEGGGKHEQQRNVAKILKFNCKKFYNN